MDEENNGDMIKPQSFLAVGLLSSLVLQMWINNCVLSSVLVLVSFESELSFWFQNGCIYLWDFAMTMSQTHVSQITAHICIM